MKQTLFAALNRFDKGLMLVLEWICIVLFAAITVILTLNIVVRFLPFMSMHWFDEIVEMCFAGLVFYGSALLWAEKGHFCVGDWISPRLPGERSRGWYRLLIAALSTAFQAVFFWYSLRLTLTATELTTVFQIPKSLLYSCMPAASLVMLAYSVCDIVVEGEGIFTARVS